MAELQFDTEQEYARRYESAEPPLFIRWVLATGLVKDKKTAQYVLVGITAIAILIMLFIWIGGGSVPPAQTPGTLGWPHPIR